MVRFHDGTFGLFNLNYPNKSKRLIFQCENSDFVKQTAELVDLLHHKHFNKSLSINEANEAKRKRGEKFDF